MIIDEGDQIGFAALVATVEQRAMHDIWLPQIIRQFRFELPPFGGDQLVPVPSAGAGARNDGRAQVQCDARVTNSRLCMILVSSGTGTFGNCRRRVVSIFAERL